MLKAFMKVLRIVEITFNAIKIRIKCEKNLHSLKQNSYYVDGIKINGV